MTNRYNPNQPATRLSASFETRMWLNCASRYYPETRGVWVCGRLGLAGAKLFFFSETGCSWYSKQLATVNQFPKAE